MPSDKDFKRVVRARMQQTGESYTAARAILLHQPVPRRAAPPRPTARVPAPAPASDLAARAGMSDQAVKAGTGCTWERWVWSLDRVEAHTWSHPRIARYIQDTWRLGSWWAQSVTVGYERIKGLREKGQRRGGGYVANKSRTFPVPLARLYRAVSDGRSRKRWLEPGAVAIRSTTKDKYARGRTAGGASVEFVFTAKDRGRSMMQVQEGPLGSRADIAVRKAFWAARLAALGEMLGR
ncbi:MAG: hypothetical protein IPI38_16645 [Gemmatimonadetes bacterium]|nr:hypothetical protein [Gemmatimonadota bacterium]MBK7717021.1 hypothetical protein [Gemmatimonadota bacterium]MBK7922147.1 hypothetical protein [Gemmatimonadota bacterium]MBK9693523.1 hypothetical protein [Gemmatimonadota bacterium]